jgi:chemotaxis protein MotB
VPIFARFFYKQKSLKKMKKIILLLLPLAILSGCVSKKKFPALETDYKTTDATLTKTELELVKCQEANKKYAEEIDYLRKLNEKMSNNLSDMATLTKQEAENLQNTLQKIKEKDLKINSLQDALTKKDSITIALVTNLKRAIGNINDEDIQINVEKGVVFVSISDKFLFKSGSYEISMRAKEVLQKVAAIVKSKPDMEVMIEGHTDNVAFKKGELIDNWDLSVKRSTALVRTLQNEFVIDPSRLIAAGRGESVPVATNETPEGRSANRRTRIIILPKLEQFYGMIEEELNKK